MQIGKISSLSKLAGRAWAWVRNVFMVIGATGAIMMMVIVAAGALSRYIFGRPIPFYDEYAVYLMVLLFATGVGYSFKAGQFIRCNAVTSRLSPKVTAWLTAFTHVIGLAFVILVIIYTTRMVIKSFVLGKTSLGLGVLLFPVQLLIPLGLTILAVEMIVEYPRVIRSLLSLLAGRDKS